MRYVSTLVSRSSPFGRRELFRTSTAGVRLLHSFVYGRRRVSHPWTRPWPVQTHCERDACAPSRPDGHSSAARQVAGDHAAEGGTPAIGALALGLINIFRCASSEGPEVARSRRFSSSLPTASRFRPMHSRAISTPSKPPSVTMSITGRRLNFTKPSLSDPDGIARLRLSEPSATLWRGSPIKSTFPQA